MSAVGVIVDRAEKKHLSNDRLFTPYDDNAEALMVYSYEDRLANRMFTNETASTFPDSVPNRTLLILGVPPSPMMVNC
jgi:hypothetical protein